MNDQQHNRALFKPKICGDTLFVGAAGRTDLIGGSLEALIESIEKN